MQTKINMVIVLTGRNKKALQIHKPNSSICWWGFTSPKGAVSHLQKLHTAFWNYFPLLRCSNVPVPSPIQLPQFCNLNILRNNSCSHTNIFRQCGLAHSPGQKESILKKYSKCGVLLKVFFLVTIIIKCVFFSSVESRKRKVFLPCITSGNFSLKSKYLNSQLLWTGITSC